MATAQTTPPTVKGDPVADSKQSVVEALGAESLPLSELQKRCSAIDIARAWAGGVIEFGHRAYCITGPVGKIGSSLVIEDGFEWSKEKTKMHKPYRDLCNETPPKVEKFKKYKLTEPKVFGEEPVLKPVEISEAEAVAEIALQVRLTDKGLGDS